MTPGSGETKDAKELLYIGGRIGGESAENANVLEAIKELGRVVDDERRDAGPKELSVDLVFDVSGPIFRFEYKRMRTGRLSRVKRMLQIQVPVPQHLPSSEIWSYLNAALVEMVELVEEYVSDHRIELSVDGLKDVVDAVIARIRESEDLAK